MKFIKKLFNRIFKSRKKRVQALAYKSKKRPRCYDCRYYKVGKVCVGGYNMTSYRRKNGCLRFLRLK